MKVYYFGCIGDAGHYFFRPEGKVNIGHGIPGPWGWAVDGNLCPLGNQRQGVGAVHHKDGWTALAFWDRSVDRRFGSCSVFLADATLDFDAMLALAREKFPSVVARFQFEITPAGTSEKP